MYWCFCKVDSMEFFVSVVMDIHKVKCKKKVNHKNEYIKGEPMYFLTGECCKMTFVIIETLMNSLRILIICSLHTKVLAGIF